MYLKVEDVVNCLRSAIRKRWPAIDHLICYDAEGPPITLHPISAVRGSPIHCHQDLRGQEVLGANRHPGSGYLEMQ